MPFFFSEHIKNTFGDISSDLKFTGELQISDDLEKLFISIQTPIVVPEHHNTLNSWIGKYKKAIIGHDPVGRVPIDVKLRNTISSLSLSLNDAMPIGIPSNIPNENWLPIQQVRAAWLKECLNQIGKIRRNGVGVIAAAVATTIGFFAVKTVKDNFDGFA